MEMLYVPDEALLVAQLRRDFMPESALDFVDNLMPSTRIKIWRVAYPNHMTILDMVAVAQNTPAWMGFRDGSFGGSGYASIAGYDTYKDNIDQWRLETGQVRGNTQGGTLELRACKRLPSFPPSTPQVMLLGCSSSPETRGKPEGNQRETRGKPEGNQRETRGKPEGNQRETDKGKKSR
jgi:hypothetical protein